MNIPDSLIRLVRAKTGVQETSVVTRYICDVLVEHDVVRNTVVGAVSHAMILNEEFIGETDKEKRERLERINNGGN